MSVLLHALVFALVGVRYIDFVGLQREPSFSALIDQNASLHAETFQYEIIREPRKVKRRVIIPQSEYETHQNELYRAVRNNFNFKLISDTKSEDTDKKQLEKSIFAENYKNAIADHPRKRNKQLSNRPAENKTETTVMVMFFSCFFLIILLIVIYFIIKKKSEVARKRKSSHTRSSRQSDYNIISKESNCTNRNKTEGGPVVTSKSWKSSFFMKDTPLCNTNRIPRGAHPKMQNKLKPLNDHLYSVPESPGGEEGKGTSYSCAECKSRDNSDIVEKIKAIEGSGKRIHIPISIPVILGNPPGNKLDTITSEEEEESDECSVSCVCVVHEDKNVTSTTDGPFAENPTSEGQSKESQFIPLQGPVKVKFKATNSIEEGESSKVKNQLDKLLLQQNNKVVYADVSFDSKDYENKKFVYDSTTETVDKNIPNSKDSSTMTSSQDSRTRSTIYGQYEQPCLDYDNQNENKRTANDTYDGATSFEIQPLNPRQEENNEQKRTSELKNAEVPAQSHYQECKASVCSNESPRGNFLKRLGNGFKKPPKVYTSTEYRAGLIQNLNQRLRGTYLYSKGTLSDSSLSQSTSIPESPLDADSGSYEIVEPPSDQEKDIDGSSKIDTTSSKRMHKFLPRLKHILKRRRQSFSGEDYLESSDNAKILQLCPECLKLFPEEINDMLRSNSLNLTDPRIQNSTNDPLHMDEIIKIFPHLYTKLPQYIKDILNTKSNDNNSLCSLSRAQSQRFNRNKESRWSEISSSFENIQCT